MRKLVKLMAAGMVIAMLAGCGISTELSERFDEAEVKSSAENVIDSLNNGDYDGVVETFSEDMKTALPADKLEESVSPTLEKAGAFQEYKSESVIGQKKDDVDMAVAVMVVTYEEQNLTYTVSFNTDMEVIGLFVK